MNIKKKRKRSYLDKDDFLSDYCQRFVKPKSSSADTNNDNGNEYITEPNESLSGKEAREFYESVTRSEPCSEKPEAINEHIRKKTKKSSIPINFRDLKVVKTYVAKLFSLCGEEGQTKDLEKHIEAGRCNKDLVDILNVSDHYGWTGVMCAAPADNVKAVEILVGEGADYLNMMDKGDNNVFDICRKNGSYRVLQYLESLTDATRIDDDGIPSSYQEKSLDEVVICELCGIEYKLSKQKAHESSTLHLFKDSTKLGPENLYSIPQNNKGFQMMLRSGWSRETGLGPEGTGRKNPIKTNLKQDRAGLGLHQERLRISHFNAFDKKAVATSSARRRNVKGNVECDKDYNLKEFKKKKVKDKMWERDLRRYMSY